MVKKIGLAVVLYAMANVASATGYQGVCPLVYKIDQATKRVYVPNLCPAIAPEIDPASAMAGLTLLAGGLAVLRGRRRKV